MKVFKWFRRLFRRQQQQVNYALLYHKVSRRLGAERSRRRQAVIDRDFLEGELNKLRREAAIGQLKRFA